MKRKFWTVLTLTLVLFAAFTQASVKAEPITIKVQGTGIVRLPPNKAQMWIGVQSEGETAEAALANNGQTVQSLLAVFAAYGPPDAIRASEFSMYQMERWDEKEQKSIPYGFNVRQVFEVQILDLAKLGTFLDGATSAGANIVYGLQYGVRDSRAAKEEAYTMAMGDAYWKAEILSRANNAKNLTLEAVEESFYYGSDYATEDGNTLDHENLVVPGQLKVNVGITATFKADVER